MLKKKIAIVTLPLINNYGGILQAFALTKFMKNLNCEVSFVNLRFDCFINNLKPYVIFFIKKYLLFFIKKYKNPKLYIAKQNKKVKNFLNDFMDCKTEPIYSKKAFEKFFKKNSFDCIILGSDQILHLNYWGFFKKVVFLNFLDENQKRIIYAGSFGRDYLDESYKQDFEFYKKSLKKFKAISVREKSAVKLFKKNFDLNANFVLDPTFLIDKNEYLEIFKNVKTSQTKGKIFTYLLDKNLDRIEILKKFAKSKNLDFFITHDANLGENPISLQEWLKNIFESEFVVTDSFHGCVFSMIFHKHFYCFINEKRGGDRFNSLLEMVDLKDRIIIEGNFVNKNINFNEVDKKLSKMREISTKFLLNSLND